MALGKLALHSLSKEKRSQWYKLYAAAGRCWCCGKSYKVNFNFSAKELKIKFQFKHVKLVIYFRDVPWPWLVRRPPSVVRPTPKFKTKINLTNYTKKMMWNAVFKWKIAKLPKAVAFPPWRRFPIVVTPKAGK